MRELASSIVELSNQIFMNQHYICNLSAKAEADGEKQINAGSKTPFHKGSHLCRLFFIITLLFSFISKLFSWKGPCHISSKHPAIKLVQIKRSDFKVQRLFVILGKLD